MAFFIKKTDGEVMPKLLQEEDIHTAVTEFYDALNEIFAGNVNSMIAIWSHSEDVTYLGPQGGILVGWERVLKAWKEQAQLKLKGRVEPDDLHVIKIGNIGIIQNYEVGSNNVNGRIEKVRIRATNIFKKEDGKWKMISHQTDLLSYLKVGLK
jgi:ketosteroid isomerase-like protein